MTPITDETHITVSRDLLRAELASMELRLFQGLVGKPEFETLESTVTALARLVESKIAWADGLMLIRDRLVAEHVQMLVHQDEIDASIRSIDEAGRIAKERLDSAASALAVETERRRREAEEIRVQRADALAIPVRTWTLRSSKATVISVCFGLIGLGIAITSVLFATGVI